jgi:putative transposase
MAERHLTQQTLFSEEELPVQEAVKVAAPIIRRAFKYRLWTNENQERELGITLETHRRLYNQCLENRKTAYERDGKVLSYVAQAAWFTQECKTNPFYARLNVHSAQQTIRRLDRSYANFFRRIREGTEKSGFPRFKSQDRFNSLTFNYPERANGCRLIGDRFRVQHIGTIRVKLHRPVQGKIKTATLKREAGKWYVIFSCELPSPEVKPSTLPVVGIDMGLTHFLTTSEGQHEPNPRYLKNELPALRRAGRSVSRKMKNGKNRKKAVVKLQKIHVRVRNLRREHHFQLACRLVRAHGLIATEGLDIQEMLGNRRFSRAIQDAGWGQFLSILKNKAESAGSEVVEVDPRGTSQRCSECQALVVKTLRDRWHSCHHCGLELDRDVNAARNILARGKASLDGACGKANVDQ